MDGEKEGVIAIGDVRRALMYVLLILRFQGRSSIDSLYQEKDILSED